MQPKTISFVIAFAATAIPAICQMQPTASPGLNAQFVPQLVRTDPPINVVCTTPIGKLNLGTIYVNTCTISGGTGRYSFAVYGLPKGLSMVTSGNSATISGTLGIGHYEYNMQFYGGGYASAFGAYGIDVVPANTYPSGKGVIRCLQKGGVSVKDQPLCQTCIVTSNGRVCDKDDNFNPTRKVPQAPAGARVTSVYLDFAPATNNVKSYTLNVMHKDAKPVDRQIAYQVAGASPKFATQAAPIGDFTGQLLESDGGRWYFSFAPLMEHPEGGMEWGLDFQYNIAWQVSPTSSKASLTRADILSENPTNAIVAVSQIPGINVADRLEIPTGSAQDWKLVAAADLTGDGVTDLVLQNETSGVIAVWQMSETDVARKLEVSTVPAPGWKVVAAADMNGDGALDLVLQNETSGAISIWQMSGTDVVAQIELSTLPAQAWKLIAAADLTGDGITDLLLQNQISGVIDVWEVSGTEVAAKLQVPVVPALGWKVVAAADLTGDGVPDLLLQNEANGAISTWKMSGIQVAAQLEVTVAPGPAGKVVAASGLTASKAAEILLQNETSRVIDIWKMLGMDVPAH